MQILVKKTSINKLILQIVITIFDPSIHKYFLKLIKINFYRLKSFQTKVFLQYYFLKKCWCKLICSTKAVPISIITFPKCENDQTKDHLGKPKAQYINEKLCISNDDILYPKIKHNSQWQGF